MDTYVCCVLIKVYSKNSGFIVPYRYLTCSHVSMIKLFVYKGLSFVATTSPILGKPRVTKSLASDQFMLNWDLPSDYHDVKDLIYSVEKCESGNDWKRIKSGIRYSQ